MMQINVNLFTAYKKKRKKNRCITFSLRFIFGRVQLELLAFILFELVFPLKPVHKCLLPCSGVLCVCVYGR